MKRKLTLILLLVLGAVIASVIVGYAFLIKKDAACCDNERDCVMDNKCYEDDGDPLTAEHVNAKGEELTCSFAHWCPIGFKYELDEGMCKWARGEICYINNDLENSKCKHYFFTQEWWADKTEDNPEDCFRNHLPTGEPTECCCKRFEFQGVTYGAYEQIGVH